MIDWSSSDKYPEDTCSCRCGNVYRSHAKYTKEQGLVSRKPCADCGKDNDLRRVESDPESFSVS